VLHPFKGAGTSFIRGAVLSAELVSEWPLANRRALHDAGRVEWFGAPNEEETEAREEGAATKKEKKETTPRAPRAPRAKKAKKASVVVEKVEAAPAAKPAKRGGRTK